jgi:hypothetical protein
MGRATRWEVRKMYGSEGIIDTVLRNFAVINLIETVQSELAGESANRRPSEESDYRRLRTFEKTLDQLGLAIGIAGVSQSAESGGSAVPAPAGESYPQSGSDLRYVAAGALLPSLFRGLVNAR